MADRKKINSIDEPPKESDRQFLERSQVGMLMRDALGKIIANRPEDPISFLAEYFESIEDNTGLVQKAEQILKMTHYSRPMFESNVRMAYDILCKHKVSKRVTGVNGAVYSDLLAVLCKGLPDAVKVKLFHRIECRNHEAVHFNVFKSGVFTCTVLGDYVKLADQLFGCLDVDKTGKANKSLSDVVVEQLHTALGSTRTDARSFVQSCHLIYHWETSFQDVSNDMSHGRIGQEWNKIFQTVEFTILESGYNLGVDGLYLALERAMSRSQRNAALQTRDQFVVDVCDAFLCKVKKFT